MQSLMSNDINSGSAATRWRLRSLLWLHSACGPSARLKVYRKVTSDEKVFFLIEISQLGVAGSYASFNLRNKMKTPNKEKREPKHIFCQQDLPENQRPPWENQRMAPQYLESFSGSTTNWHNCLKILKYMKCSQVSTTARVHQSLLSKVFETTIALPIDL